MEPNSNPEKQPLVLHELEMVEKKLEGVESLIQDLSERLTPVMCPQLQGEAVEESCKPLEVPLADRLKMVGRRLGNSIDSLKSIFDRLEI